MIVRKSSFQLGDPDFKVLVADDCAPNRRVLEALFQACGCVVTLGHDGGDAVTMALNQTFDLICLDRHMPELTGDEVAETVRAAYGRGPRPFLVLCTSDPRPGDGGEPFDAALPKPTGAQDVVKVVARALHAALSARRRSRLHPAASRSPLAATLLMQPGQGGRA